ncbi:MAG TPA: condensation domain-containing protein, partial [Alcaligenes sp.]|nr:condensation domain-containing protein [Alcaligenes sp.]HRL28451.1 condensation domain-containing protein [Alcaligenes sp.]
MSRKEERAARRAALSPAQKEALQARLKGGGAAIEQQTIFAAHPRQDGVVSFAQQRQWFLWQLDPDNTAYHMCGGLRLAGELDVQALNTALQTVLERHAALRTTFLPDERDGVRAVIHKQADLDIRVRDLGQTSEASLDDRIAQVCQRPFDLIKGPVWRFELLKVAPQEHYLLVVVHHIACDEWSVQIILNELQTLYRAARLGEVAQLADLLIDYADYAQWQRGWMQGQQAAQQLSWWRNELGNEHEVIALPVDQPRRADAQYHAAQHSFTLDAALVERLKVHAAQAGATLFMSLMTAFHAWLYRYTGQTLIRVGIPLAQRSLPETRSLVGMFVNTQIVQSRLAGSMDLNALFERVRMAVIHAQAHQELPFDHLVEAVQPQRQLGVHPLFQVLFNHLRRGGQAQQDWPGLEVQRLHFAEPHAQFELAVQTLEEESGALTVSFVYAQELFHPERVARMAEHYRTVLMALLESGTTRLDAVEMLSPLDIQLALECNVNRHQPPQIEPVHRLFESQAATHPDAIAVLDQDGSLSYGEL